MLLVYIIIIIIILFLYMSRRTERFCSSCSGPIVHRYKYGDPFYRYLYNVRRKY